MLLRQGRGAGGIVFNYFIQFHHLILKIPRPPFSLVVPKFEIPVNDPVQYTIGKSYFDQLYKQQNDELKEIWKIIQCDFHSPFHVMGEETQVQSGCVLAAGHLAVDDRTRTTTPLLLLIGQVLSATVPCLFTVHQLLGPIM